MPDHLLPDDDALLRIAGAATFKRAKGYVSSGSVDITRKTSTTIEAEVTGHDDYLVKLSLLDFEGKSSCTCPAFGLGALCKHVIATAIVARDGAPEDQQRDQQDDAPPAADLPGTDLREFLARQPAAQLAAWLAELAEANPAIEKRLRVHQARQNPAALRKALSKLLRAPSFLDWRRSRIYARELDAVVETLASVATADPQQGAGLYDYALRRLFKIYERSDDSGGDIGEQLRQIASDYLQLLESLPPGGATSAKALLELQELDDWSMLPVRSVWAVLNDAGRAAYAGCIEAEYAELPKPTAQNRSDFWRGSGFAAVHRMEALADVRGDIGTLIKVLSRDLSGSGHYVRIVNACVSAGRHREAQQWAERGLKAHPEAHGMRALVARQYLHSGLIEEARELFWQEFQRARNAESWSELRECAGDDWPAFRERALEFLQGEERATADGRRDASDRVMLLLHDGDVEAARLLGEAQGLGVHALEILARRVESSHPKSAAGFLKRIVDFELPRAQARQYENLARKIAQVSRLAPGQETLNWVLGIRTRYQARRKFLGAIEAAMTPEGSR